MKKLALLVLLLSSMLLVAQGGEEPTTAPSESTDTPAPDESDAPPESDESDAPPESDESTDTPAPDESDDTPESDEPDDTSESDESDAPPQVLDLSIGPVGVQEYFYTPLDVHGIFYSSGFYTVPAIQQGFHLGVGIGFSSNNDSALTQSRSYQIFQLQMQYTYEKFSIILYTQLRVGFTLAEDPGVWFATEDWIPTDTTDALQKYLPILQLRYGDYGDPIHLRLGFLSDITMGNGLLVQDYTNSLDIINVRTSGFFAHIDAEAFGFPYAGIELLMGDLIQVDSIAARVFLRPLASLKRTYLSEMLVGASFGMNRNSFTSFDDDQLSVLRGGDPTYIAGGDLLFPLIAQERLQMEVQLDYLWQSASEHVFRGGARWKILKFIDLHTNFLFLTPGAYANYFDRNLQQTGIKKSLYVRSQLDNSQGDRYLLEARALFTFLNDGFKIGAFVQTPFSFTPAVLERVGGISAGLELKIIEERIKALSGVTLALHYVKSGIMDISELASLSDAFIGGKLGLRARAIRIEIIVELRPRYQALRQLQENGLDLQPANLLTPFENQSLSDYAIYTGVQGVISF